MTLVHNLEERLRAILSLKSWDYCVIWRLSEDQRVLEWVDCCCAGAENIHNGEEFFFPVSSALACKDVIIQHPRTKSCDLLTELPSSVPLDSGIYAEALMSNQATWMNFSPNLDSTVSGETIGTIVLIPIPGGLVEFFVAKQVPEDPQIIEFITAQCNITLEHQGMIHSNNINSNVQVNVNGFHDAPSNPLPSVEIDQNIPRDVFNFTGKNNVDVPRDISLDPMPLSHSSTLLSQQHNHTSDSPGSKNNVMFFQGTHHELNPFTPSTENGFQDMDVVQKHMMSHEGNMFMHMVEPLEDKEDQGNDNDSFKGRSNSMSDSDPNEDDEDAKYRRRTGKGAQCKNLEAERKRRKKLNERLYTLRSLVPKISKLDRASIIGDAIEFVKDLQKQVKDLQNELEEHSDDDDDDDDQSNIKTSQSQQDTFQQNGMTCGYKSEHENISNRYHKGIAGNGGIDLPKQNQESENTVDRVQQMEPQVEVAQLDGNEFFVRVFCEHKPGGFVRLTEALNSLGLEASHVNATRHTCLVSNIFKVERKDHEMIQAEYIRDSLLELTRNPPSEDGNRTDHQGGRHHHNLPRMTSHQFNSHHLHC